MQPVQVAQVPCRVVVLHLLAQVRVHLAVPVPVLVLDRVLVPALLVPVLVQDRVRVPAHRLQVQVPDQVVVQVPVRVPVLSLLVLVQGLLVLVLQ